MGSVAIHVVIGALLFGVDHARVEDEPVVAHLEILEAPAGVLVDVSRALESGGGSSGSRGGAAQTPKPATPVLLATRASRRASARAFRDDARALPDDTMRDQPRSLRDQLGDVAIEARDGNGDPSGTTGGDGKGEGGGVGGGRGRGFGRGIADGAIDPSRVVVPAAPRVSKARPPKLIYPSRERDVGDGELLFIARVTIDTDGYVAGARLVQGVGGHKDDQASAQIFRFRYAPALDEDGKPIRATVDQPFLVQ